MSAYLPAIFIVALAIVALWVAARVEHERRQLGDYEEFTEGGPVYVYHDEDLRG